MQLPRIILLPLGLMRFWKLFFIFLFHTLDAIIRENCFFSFVEYPDPQFCFSYMTRIVPVVSDLITFIS